MTDTHVAALFFLQIAAILFVCRAVGWLGKKIGQPQVVGEMVAGFLMGPSLFGWLGRSADVPVSPLPLQEYAESPDRGLTVGETPS